MLRVLTITKIFAIYRTSTLGKPVSTTQTGVCQGQLKGVANMFVEKLLARAAELQDVRPDDLDYPDEGKVKTIGAVSSRLVGFYAAFKELKAAAIDRLEQIRQRIVEIEQGDGSAEDVAQAKDLRNEAQVRALEVNVAKNLFWCELRLEYPQLAEADHIGLAKGRGCSPVVVVEFAEEVEEEVPDFVRALAERFGARVEVLHL